MIPSGATPDWSESVRVEGSPERERFLEAHLDSVRYTALRIAGRLPASVDAEDLVHDGVLGLIDAVARFDPARGVPFRAYADARIQGAILDGLRRKDWRPRSVRANQRSLDDAVGRLAGSRGGPAGEEEIAREMGLGIGDYRAMLVGLRSGPLLSLDEFDTGERVPADEGARPDRGVERKDLLEAVAQEIGALPERERRVLELYYHEELNMKEVGAVLGVTESRVCQLHAQAAGRLRSALRARMRPAAPPERRERQRR